MDCPPTVEADADEGEEMLVTVGNGGVRFIVKT